MSSGGGGGNCIRALGVVNGTSCSREWLAKLPRTQESFADLAKIVAALQQRIAALETLLLIAENHASLAAAFILRLPVLHARRRGFTWLNAQRGERNKAQD